MDEQAGHAVTGHFNELYIVSMTSKNFHDNRRNGNICDLCIINYL